MHDDDPDLPYVPLPDKHQLALDAMEERIRRLTPLLKPKWREAVRLSAQGKGPTEIAEQLDITPASVSQILKREHCQQYMAALTAHTAYMAGPTIAARRQMLWRIAQGNEDEAPRVSIQAVDVLNKTDGVYQEHLQPGEGNVNIQIINNFSQAPVREREVREAGVRPTIEGHAVAVEVEIE